MFEPLSSPLDASKASIFTPQASDIALLIEEATETVVNGHCFDNPAIQPIFMEPKAMAMAKAELNGFGAPI